MRSGAQYLAKKAQQADYWVQGKKIQREALKVALGEFDGLGDIKDEL